MKKKKLLMSLLCLLALFLITGCEQAKSKSKFIDQLREYEKKFEILNGKSFDEYYSPKELSYLKNDIKGLLSISVYKMNDNQENALAFYIEDEQIKVDLLEEGESKVNVLHSTELTKYSGSEFELIGFTTKIDNKIKLFIEMKTDELIVADGVSFKLLEFSVSNSEINIENEISLEGSSITNYDISDYINKVKKTGLNSYGIDDSIFNQNKNVVKLFGISRKLINDFNVDDYYMSSDDKIKYGATSFNNYIDDYNIEINNVSIDESKIEKYNDSYIGNYVWVSGNDTIEFSLQKTNENIEYYMSFYPNDSVHASEELWGKWKKSDSIKNLDNQYTSSIASYSFNNIKYVGGNIEIDIELKDVLIPELKEYAISDGNYTFVKE